MEPHTISTAHFLAILVVIWVGAKIAGEIAHRLKQPPVLGELMIGIILGPSLLNLVPANNETLHLLSEIGVCILLFEIGLATKLKDFLQVGLSSLLIALVGVIVPFILGLIATDISINMGLTNGLAKESTLLVSIFVGASLTATSVGITARVLADMNRLQLPESRMILGAAVIDDVIGIVILSVVTSLATAIATGQTMAQALSFWGVTKTLAVAAGFLIGAVIIGQKMVHPLFNLVQKMRGRGVLFVAALSFALFLAFLADVAGSAMIIGAFTAGILLAETDKFELIEEKLKPVADLFTPIFFVTVGTMVDLHAFSQGSALILGVILFAVAVLGKLVAGFGAYKRQVSLLVIGVGMIPRGEVGLIFAQQGLKANLLTQDLFSAIAFMVITTTLIVPPLLQLVFKRYDAKKTAT